MLYIEEYFIITFRGILLGGLLNFGHANHPIFII